MREATYVIVGGGIAGVSCAEGLAFLSSNESILLISASPMIKTIYNVKNLTKMLSRFDVREERADSLSKNNPSISVIQDVVVSLDHVEKKLLTVSGEIIYYEKLCLCTGAAPKLIGENPRIIGIRDTDSVIEFQKSVSSSRKMVVIGNGGIATELVHEITGMEIVWVIKDAHISATFIDPGAAEFFQGMLAGGKADDEEGVSKRMRFSVEPNNADGGCGGAALGPDWHTNCNLQGVFEGRQVSVEYKCEVSQVLPGNSEWPVLVELTNGKTIGCDFIVSATGVVPNVSTFSLNQFELAPDGGLKVNWKMETSIPDVYAAGDVCTAVWDLAPQWFQMRLWTQARQMGTYAAKAMHCSIQGEELLQDFCFELFTHVTKFFGTKVVLLGLFNGQTLENNYEILLRVTKGQEYVKIILKDGRMQGAVLIGETDLEEMCENLILNQLDLSDFKEELLNPDIDIEDYFD